MDISLKQTKTTDIPNPATHPYEYAQWYCLNTSLGHDDGKSLETLPCGSCAVCVPCNAFAEMLDERSSEA